MDGLVSRIIAGDREAEAELIHRYSRAMFIVISKIVHNHTDAEDVLQEMFLTALKKIRRGEVNEPDRLSGFILGIAKNLALRHIRRVEKRPLTDIDKASPLIDPNRDPHEQLLQKEEADIVRQVLKELKQERVRQIIIRYDLLEEDKDAICANLGVSRVYFNKVRFRALERFKELYKQKQSSKKPRNQTPGAK